MINFSLRSTHGAISSRISLARPIKLTYYSKRLLLKLPGDNVCRIPVSAVHRVKCGESCHHCDDCTLIDSP